MIEITIRGQLTIDDRTAYMLEYVTSYDLAEWFAEHCSHKYTAEQIKDTLCSIRSECATIIAARQAACHAVNERLNPRKSPPAASRPPEASS